MVYKCYFCTIFISLWLPSNDLGSIPLMVPQRMSDLGPMFSEPPAIIQIVYLYKGMINKSMLGLVIFVFGRRHLPLGGPTTILLLHFRIF